MQQEEILKYVKLHLLDVIRKRFQNWRHFAHNVMLMI